MAEQVPDMDARRRAEAIAEELIATYGAFASNAALPRGEHPGEECSRMFTACITSAIEAAVAQEREACALIANAEAQTAAISLYRAREAGRELVATCRETDVETATRIMVRIRARGVGGKTEEGEGKGKKPAAV